MPRLFETDDQQHGEDVRRDQHRELAAHARRDEPAGVVAPEVSDAVRRREQADEAAEHEDERRQTVDPQCIVKRRGHAAGEELRRPWRRTDANVSARPLDDDDLLEPAARPPKPPRAAVTSGASQRPDEQCSRYPFNFERRLTSIDSNRSTMRLDEDAENQHSQNHVERRCPARRRAACRR